MNLLRALTHSLIILTLALIGSAFATRGIATILGYLAFGSFLPFALATAACINHQRGLLITTLLMTILAIVPCTIEEVARALVPIGAGITLGLAVQRALTESREVTSE